MTETIEKSGILRDLKIYACASSNGSMFGTYAFAYRITDGDGVTVACNLSEDAVLFSGSVDQGHHAALLDALPCIRPAILDRSAEWLQATADDPKKLSEELEAPRSLTIITSKGDAIFRAYTYPTETLVASGFKQKSGHLWANAAWIARFLAEAEELGVTVLCRPAETIEEEVTLELTRNEGKRRWSRAQKQLRAKYQ
ncbi:hypothetical protein [Agrobacterium fabrum]|uniref:hypothetical protein n=1 Tax=Agrobacterium fabrum TaxID=1176649 RepID=UPI003BA3B3D3